MRGTSANGSFVDGWSPWSVSNVFEGFGRWNMTIFRQVDWFILWKFFHFQFFIIYLIFGILLRVFHWVREERVLVVRKGLYVITSSLATALLNTWLPVLPVICGLVVMWIARDATGKTSLSSVVVVAASMGLQAAGIEQFIARFILKRPVKKEFLRCLVMNLIDASVALVVGLMWSFHHLPNMIAALEGLGRAGFQG